MRPISSSTTGSCSRRNFLRGAGGASTAALVAAAAAAPVRTAQAYDPGKHETGPRYRETEHVKEFYRTNGYEGVKR